ncbi:MAG TPA: chloride channel protein [Pirellulales bacterium]|nr:chloride channel protein [Pirellulales bacterium]
MPKKSANRPIPSHPFRWIPEFWTLGRQRFRSQARLMMLSMLVGVIAGLGAVVFFLACQTTSHLALDRVAGYRPEEPGGERPIFKDTQQPFRPWMLLVVATAGGVVSGVIVYSLAPEAEGHGTDAAIEAYHQRQGLIRPRVPLVKIVASAITLGTGGSGGREGPIAQIGAGFGSYLGGLLKLRAVDRRVLMAAGMGAGVAAIFRAPLAGALFAAEVLYRSPDFESEVVIPAGMASVTAYSTFGLVFGWQPLFELSPEVLKVLSFNNPLALVPYSLLAICMIALAAIYTRTFYGLTHVFHQLKIKPHFRPAIGACLSAVVGLAIYFALGDEQTLAVLSFGYGVLQDALVQPASDQASLSAAVLLLAVAFGKILTTALTIGSGGSGGVFGPSMVIGGCGGGALGIALHWVWPELAPHPASFVIVGMAGFFAAAAKTPFSTLVMVSELTGNYNLLLPTLWVCTLAFVFSDEQSIYSCQVENRSRSPAHQGDYIREVLKGLRVGQFMTAAQSVPTVHPDDPLGRVLSVLGDTSYQGLPVTDAEGRLLGVVELEEVHLASQLPHAQSMFLVADLMRSDITPLRAGDPLDRALELFVANDCSELPLVDEGTAPKVVGIVKRSDISTIYLRYVHGEGNGAPAGIS